MPKSTKANATPDLGDFVQVMFDTGCTGWSVLYGCVVQSGPRAYTVLWESGLKNQIRRHGNRSHLVSPARDPELAGACLQKAQATRDWLLGYVRDNPTSSNVYPNPTT